MNTNMILLKQLDFSLSISVIRVVASNDLEPNPFDV